MSAAQVRETLNEYVEVLLARGDYGRFFADDVHFEVAGTDQSADGAEATEQAIRFLHELAFDARPDSSTCWSTRTARPPRRSSPAPTSASSRASGRPATPSASRTRLLRRRRTTASPRLRIYMSLEQLVAQITAPAHATTAG